MPTQSLRTAPPHALRPPSSPRAMGLRRLTVIGGAVALTIVGAHEMYLVFAVNGVTVLAIFMLALFLALFAWIALSFTSGLAGFCSLLRGGGCRLGTATDAPLPQLSSRTALLMPTYNEEPARIMAGLQAIWESTARNRCHRSVRPVHPERYHRSADLDRRGGRFPGIARAHGRIQLHLLSSAHEERRAQVRQHRGLGRPGSAAAMRTS